MTAPSSKPLPGTLSDSSHISEKAWDYADQISVMLGCAIEQTSRHDVITCIKAALTDAQKEGLNPEEIYQVVAAEGKMISSRLPNWDDVNPTPSQKPPTT